MEKSEKLSHQLQKGVTKGVKIRVCVYVSSIDL
jgi:hypothetical protein